MPKTETIHSRVDPELEAEVDRLAAAKGRTKSWLVDEALRSYVANERQFQETVEEGRKALRERRTVDHRTVVDTFNRKIAPDA